jgi:carboxyl-terminal processing protease
MRKGYSIQNIVRRVTLIIVLGVALIGFGFPKEADLTAKDRVRIFEQVWKLVNENYYSANFNGVDWNRVRERYRPQAESASNDDEFYTVLRHMVGELRDAHTQIITPEEREYEKRKQGVTIGVRVREVEGKPTIISVAPQSEADQSGLKPGMRVLSINNVNIAEYLKTTALTLGAMSSDRATIASEYGHLFRGDPGTPVTLTVTGLDNKPFTVTLKRRIVDASAQVSKRKLSGGIGYIKMTAWESPADTQFEEALSEMHDSSGLIIDLRGNGGGEAGIVFKLANLFFRNKVSLGKFISRSGKITETFSNSHKGPVYESPVSILVDEGSASGSELFAGVMQEHGRAKIIGRESCGCLLVVQKLSKLYGGAQLSISELDFKTPNGKRLEGIGVVPDQIVPLRRDDLLAGRDAALEAAQQRLNEVTKK